MPVIVNRAALSILKIANTSCSHPQLWLLYQNRISSRMRMYKLIFFSIASYHMLLLNHHQQTLCRNIHWNQDTLEHIAHNNLHKYAWWSCYQHRIGVTNRCSSSGISCPYVSVLLSRRRVVLILTSCYLRNVQADDCLQSTLGYNRRFIGQWWKWSYLLSVQRGVLSLAISSCTSSFPLISVI